MSVQVTYNLANINRVYRQGTKISTILKNTSDDIIVFIKKNWLSGIGGDGTKLRAYTPGYAKWKKKMVGSDQVSLALFGDMQNAFVSRKEKETRYALTFKNRTERLKAIDNYILRKNMMRVNKTFVRKASEKILKFLFGK